MLVTRVGKALSHRHRTCDPWTSLSSLPPGLDPERSCWVSLCLLLHLTNTKASQCGGSWTQSDLQHFSFVCFKLKVNAFSYYHGLSSSPKAKPLEGY